jgi:hypothetical protein
MFRRRSLIAALAAAATISLASLAVVQATPAGATTTVEIVKNGNTDYFVDCTANSDYGASSYRPITFIYNSQCAYRVWLHQYYYGYHDWGGWTYCISPYSYSSISGEYEQSADVYVSSNTSSC